MRMSRTTFTIIPLLFLSSLPTLAGEVKWGRNGLTQSRFESLATELAPKVNLFREVWRQVPDAEFTGGTVRDFLYWLRMKLDAAQSEEELEVLIAKLRSDSMIDVRDFVHEESDIDYSAPAKKRASVVVEDFGVKKLDAVLPDRFTPGTEAYVSEVNQGYIPIEKMLLGRARLRTAPGFGNGVGEVFTGKPSMHLSSAAEFASTTYAKLGANHPILLVMRYIRTLSLNYAKTGHSLGDYPKLKEILNGVDPALRERMSEIVKSAVEKDELTARFKNASFVNWYRATLEKSFRAYVHPTATHLLYVHFGLDRVVTKWPERSIQINQYVYAKPRLSRDLAEYDQKIRDLGFDPADVFSSPESILGPERELAHGTRTENAFQDILVRGIVSSESGSAGQGVYGVPMDNIGFAIQWAGDKNRVVKFKLKPESRLLDSVSGSAAAISFYKSAIEKFGIDQFADELGIDGIVYPYNTRALVIKNGGILGAPKGIYRSVLTYSQALERAPILRTTLELVTFLEGILLSKTFTTSEFNSIYSKLSGFPVITKSLQKLDFTRDKDRIHAKSLFIATYTMMRAVSEESEITFSNQFIHRLVFEPSMKLSRSSKNLKSLAKLLDEARPAQYDSKMSAKLVNLLGAGSFDYGDAFRRIKANYLSRGPWQVFAFLHAFPLAMIAASNFLPSPDAQGIGVGLGIIMGVMDSALLWAEWSEISAASKQASVSSSGLKTMRKILRQMKFKSPGDCTELLDTPEPKIP